MLNLEGRDNIPVGISSKSALWRYMDELFDKYPGAHWNIHGEQFHNCVPSRVHPIAKFYP